MRKSSHAFPGSFAQLSLIPRDMDFRSRIANFLEMFSIDSHYSVIGRNIPGSPAAGHAGDCPLNEEVTASKSDAAAPGAEAGRFLPCAHAQGGDE
jgi:hypothetical protein